MAITGIPTLSEDSLRLIFICLKFHFTFKKKKKVHNGMVTLRYQVVLVRDRKRVSVLNVAVTNGVLIVKTLVEHEYVYFLPISNL